MQTTTDNSAIPVERLAEPWAGGAEFAYLVMVSDSPFDGVALFDALYRHVGYWEREFYDGYPRETVPDVVAHLATDVQGGVLFEHTA